MTATEKLPEEDWLVSAEQVKEHVVLIRAPQLARSWLKLLTLEKNHA